MTRQQTLFAGFMVFALFLGAGNIIFPPMLGFASGEFFSQALIGFLLTAVGLPAVTLIAIAWMGSGEGVTEKLPRWLQLTFWSTLFLTIGPFFNMPRTFSVAYEFTAKPFYGDDLMPFVTLVFAAITLFFALSPSKLMDRVGKLITPCLITIFVVLIVSVYMMPHGTPTDVSARYLESAFASGLSEGYMTMDVLGAIGFGGLVIAIISQRMNADSGSLTKKMSKIVVVYASIITALYMAMAWIGSQYGAQVSNGGELLSSYTQWMYGNTGAILLGAIMTLACLTTAIGLSCASAKYFSDNFKFVSYKPAVVTIVAVTTVVANVGLAKLIEITLPLVVVLHPVTISVVALAVFYKHKPFNLMVWGTTVTTAILFGVIDALNILGQMPADLEQAFNQYLPLYQYNAAWIIPTLAVFMALTALAKVAYNISRSRCAQV
ncbi:branched-chain amino acid transport system II carrier protein [Shewanella sp. WXL01]|uniref:branched-chain amino acid transport system II carrier protein n=1 Tax=Shewanella sp. WXL01 TaxID=2709721 RepID=UPI0014384652|nr:branched-chain amino acid transport system II carrier protein [Shewanella sp. WXL01]